MGNVITYYMLMLIVMKIIIFVDIINVADVYASLVISNDS